MLLSVFTPSHNTQYLLETYESLLTQQHTEWEWLIGLNGDARLPDDERLRKDKRVHVFHLGMRNPNIGALKFACCQRARGEALIELDHDDILWPDVLTHVAKHIDAGADFVFSDAASYDDEKNRAVWYSEHHGWETYPVTLYGRQLMAVRNFAITPRSLCEVYYAPDHVRCWRRSFYEKIGGHDVTLSVGDDHDLICRSYIAQGKFAHTGTVGYVYRFHRGNTVKARNAAIQQQNRENRRKYIHLLIDEWCRRKSLGFLDLARHVEWHDGMPQLGNTESSSIGCIRAYDVLHLVHRQHVSRVMEECYRVLAPLGWLCVQVFSTNGAGAFVPAAESYWNPLTFDYFCDRNLAVQIQPYRGRFQNVQCYEAFVDPARDQPLNRISVYADLCAIKKERMPGLTLI